MPSTFALPKLLSQHYVAMSGQEKRSSRESSRGKSDNDSEDSVPVESLVAGRAKRSAAGNRYSSLIQAEVDQDDDVALLFAEDEEEEDNEFQEDDEADASDIQLDSSSDDEDQGPAAGADSLEGEKEIQQQDRAERKKKRKAQELFKRPRSSFKKVKYDPTATASIAATPQPRPKKKSERTSWIPTPDQGPTRSSQRKQTVLNKEVTHLRLQESEVRRRQTIKAMEEAAKKKEASKPKAMTQEDRMTEASRVEKANEKSLTKWEENEKKRVEEQKARLAALHNRQLNGPVITWWSGPAKWVDENLAQVGSKKIRDVESQKEKVLKELPSEGRAPTQEPLEQGNTPDTTKQNPSEDVSTVQEQEPSVATAPESSTSNPPMSSAPLQLNSLAQMPATTENAQHSASSTLPSQVYSIPAHQPQQEFDGYYSGPASAPTFQVAPERLHTPPLTTVYPVQLPPQPPRPKTPVVEIAVRNLVALRNIDLNSTEPRIAELQDHILLAKKPTKASGKQAHSNSAPKSAGSKGLVNGRQQVPCAITGQSAKYRDPKTGLAYADAAAYKEIQKLRTGQTQWSELHGCYTGPAVGAARGVPERFLSS